MAFPAIIDAFLDHYIVKPFKKLDCTVGVEVNFNKEFYKPEVVEPVESILAEISSIEKELTELENNLIL